MLYIILIKLALLQAPADGVFRGRGGSILFTSNAPLEVISAESNELSGIVDMDKNTFAFLVPTKSFKGFNSPLQQEHFHENYMESSDYPTATFSGKFIEDINALKKGENTVRAKGVLAIHGQEVERILKCILTIEENKILISSNFSVPLSDHNIPIPQVVNQKIAELIEVEVQLELKPK